jgi:hypothetical protein
MVYYYLLLPLYLLLFSVFPFVYVYIRVFPMFPMCLVSKISKLRPLDGLCHVCACVFPLTIIAFLRHTQAHTGTPVVTDACACFAA